MLSVRQLTLAYGGPPLFSELSFEVRPGERACIVGRNGAGKSSLLKVIAGWQQPDGGEVQAVGGGSIAYLPQEVPDDVTGNVAEVIAQHLPDTLEFWQQEAAVDKLLRDLALPGEAAFSELSVGQQRRALLGRALAPGPTVLLLDEPTNHLDLASIGWLETYLPKFRGALLFVTHDRAFLRQVATRILDLDRGKLISWACDYDNYLLRKEEWLAAEAHQRAEFDKKLAQEEVWVRQGIKARRTRNEGRVRALEKMRAEHRARRERQGTARLALDEADRSGVKVVEAEGVQFAYGDRVILRDFDCLITRGDKLGIVGPNGAGKSTLLKLLLGQLSPQSGTLTLGTKLEIAYFDQLKETLQEDRSLLDTVADGRESVTVQGQSRNVMGYLQDFLFSPAQARGKVKALSGGERNRLLLARLFTRPFNLLVLDEPTNDLDVETLELLEDLLVNYAGTLLLVSHDRAFIDNVATGTLVMTGDGRVEQFVGGFTDALAARPGLIKALTTIDRDNASNTSAAAAAIGNPAPKPTGSSTAPTATANGAPKAATGRASATAAAPGAPAVKTGRRLSQREKTELEKLPAIIEKLEAQQADLTTRLTRPEVLANPTQRNTLTTQLQQTEAQLATHFARWEALEELRAQAAD